MQKFFFLIFLSLSFKTYGEQSYLSINGKIKYSQDFSFSKQKTSSLEFTEWGQSFHGNLKLMGNIGENFIGKVLATHQNRKLTCDNSYFKEAYLGVGKKDIFFFKIGCLPAHKFGWDEIRFDLASVIKSPLRESLYAQKYKKMIELNSLIFGDLSLQVTHDTNSEKEENQIGLNLSWHEKFSFFSPLIQFSIFESFKSYSYTLGMKFNFNPFKISLDGGRKKELQKSSQIYFNLLADYSLESQIVENQKDHISASYIGLLEENQDLKSEVHLSYLINLAPHVSAFSDIFLELSDSLSFNLSLGMSAFL